MSQKAVHLSYVRRMAATSAAYIVSVFAVSLLVNTVDLPRLVRTLLAFIPMFPIIYGLWAYSKFTDQLDELQRLIQNKAIVLSAGLTGILTTSYGFLQAYADFPPIELIWIFPMMIVLWGFSQAYYERKYGGTDE